MFIHIQLTTFLSRPLAISTEIVCEKE